MKDYDAKYLKHLSRSIGIGLVVSLIAIAAIIYIIVNNISSIYLAPATVVLLCGSSLAFVSRLGQVRIRALRAEEEDVCIKIKRRQM